MYGIANMGIAPEDLENEIDVLIKQVQDEGISEQDFQKLQNIIENNLVSKNASIEGIAQNLAEANLFFGDTEYINKELEVYRKVSREDIQRVANKYLTLDGRVVLYYLPKPKETAQNQ
jgi:predicted Zn-dependent peptidase